MNNFSVVMSVYRNDKPEFVRRAVESVTTEQTLKPDEVVLVVDGAVPVGLTNLIKSWKNRNKLGQCAGRSWDTFDVAKLMIFS